LREGLIQQPRDMAVPWISMVVLPLGQVEGVFFAYTTRLLDPFRLNHAPALAEFEKHRPAADLDRYTK